MNKNNIRIVDDGSGVFKILISKRRIKLLSYTLICTSYIDESM